MTIAEFKMQIFLLQAFHDNAFHGRFITKEDSKHFSTILFVSTSFVFLEQTLDARNLGQSLSATVCEEFKILKI